MAQYKLSFLSNVKPYGEFNPVAKVDTLPLGVIFAIVLALLPSLLAQYKLPFLSNAKPIGPLIKVLSTKLDTLPPGVIFLIVLPEPPPKLAEYKFRALLSKC